MSDHSTDESHPRLDHALREMLTPLDPPPPAPHARHERVAAIHLAIDAAWTHGHPPTPEDLAREPHPADFWDNWPRDPFQPPEDQYNPDRSGEHNSTINDSESWSSGMKRLGERDDKPGRDHRG